MERECERRGGGSWSPVEKKYELVEKKKESGMMKAKLVENMVEGRSNRCRTRCCPQTRRYGNIARVGTYRTGVGAIIACEGEVVKESK